MRGASIVLFLPAFLVATTCAAPRTEPAGTIERLLLGRWTLISWLVTDESGQASEPFGAEPDGVMGYRDSGEIGILVGNPTGPSLDVSRVNPYVAQARLNSMWFSYNGKFEFDESTMSITHHVERSINEFHLGPTYTWHVESIDDDYLVLSTTFESKVSTRASLRGMNSTRWKRTR